jgi:hypothetical protein
VSRYNVKLSLTDVACGLLAVVFILCVISAMGDRVRDYAWNEYCTSNLRQIGEALANYAADNRGAYPRTRWDRHSAKVTQFTGSAAADPFGVDGPEANDVTAAVFLLVRAQKIKPDVFLCPLTRNAREAPLLASRSNFADPRSLGYSFACPYPTAAVAEAGYRWNNKMSGELPVAADLNPGAPALQGNAWEKDPRPGNSPNHWGGSGQCVLFGDSHVERMISRFVGVQRDNIYTFGASGLYSAGVGVEGPPANPNDSILLPVAYYDPGARMDPWERDRRTERVRRIIQYGSLAVLVTMIALRIRAARGRRKLHSPRAGT